MEIVRDIISRGSPLAQLQHEVTTLSKPERESLLDSVVGSENSVDIPADEVLAMKTDLYQINYFKFRYSIGKEFSIRVFLSGDYEFLCHMYGLSGASGRLL